MNAFTHEPGTTSSDLLSSSERWKPDAGCIAAGDRYVELALVCWSELSAWQARWRLEMHAAALTDGLPDCGPWDAAIAFAKHCRMANVSPERTIQLLARLSVAVPDWRPQAPDELQELVGSLWA